MIDFKDLLKAGVHFGHKTSFWNAKMRPYIWGSKNRVHLLDISKTAFLLEHTGKQLKKIAANGGSILWVGTKKSAQKIIKKTAIDLKMPYVINRWIGGTLTNYSQIKKAITRLLHLQDVVKKSQSHYTKKEMVMLQKQVARLEKNIGGIVDLAFPPAAVVVVDAKREQSAIKEAAGVNVPVSAIVDTNTDPSNIDFVIPANDDSPKSVGFIIDYLAACVAEGQKIAKENKDKAVFEKKAEKKKVEAPAPKKVVAKPEAKTEVKAKKAEKKEEKPSTDAKASISTKASVSKPADKKKEAPKKVAEKKVVVKKTTTKKSASPAKSKVSKAAVKK